MDLFTPILRDIGQMALWNFSFVSLFSSSQTWSKVGNVFLGPPGMVSWNLESTSCGLDGSLDQFPGFVHMPRTVWHELTCFNVSCGHKRVNGVNDGYLALMLLLVYAVHPKWYRTCRHRILRIPLQCSATCTIWANLLYDFLSALR